MIVDYTGRRRRGAGAIRLAIFFWLLVAIVPSARAGEPHEEDVTVKVFNLPSPRDTSPANIADVRVLKRFQELNPHIRLEASTQIQVAGAGTDAASLMAIAGGMSPDIIYVNFRQSDTYIQQHKCPVISSTMSIG